MHPHTFISRQTLAGVTYASISNNLPTFKTKFKRSVVATLNNDNVKESNINITSIADARRRSLLAGSLRVEYLIIANHITYSTLSAAVTSNLSSTSFVSTLSAYTGYTFTGVSTPTVVNLSPTASPTKAPTKSSSSSSSSLSVGAIIGIAVGAGVGLILIGVAVYYFVFRGSSVGQPKIESGGAQA
jgi:hypothetical protein